MLALDKLPLASGTPDATTIIAYLKTLLTLISGEVNFGELEKVVIAAESTALGWSSALNAIKADQVNVFPDALTRPLGVYLISVVAKLVGVTLT